MQNEEVTFCEMLHNNCTTIQNQYDYPKDFHNGAFGDEGWHNGERKPWPGLKKRSEKK